MGLSITNKRRPWPHDIYIGGVPLRLNPEDGNLVTQKTKTLEATAPVDFTYNSANPFKERAFEWKELYGGFGQSEAPDGTPRRYDHGEFVDTSIDGLTMLGPRFEDHVETIGVGSGAVIRFVKAMHGSTLTVFCICSNGVYRRVSDGTWANSLTFPAGTHGQDGIRFKHRGTTPVDALYVATDNANLYQYNGTTWTLAGAAAGPGTGVVQGEARYLERVGDELWVAGNYWVAKVEDDPMDRSKYGAVIYIGDQSNKITQLAQVDNTLYIWKEDGLYTVDEEGEDVDLFPTLRGKLSPTNGRNAAVWIDKIWFSFGDQTFRVDGNGVLSPDGLEQMLENISDVRGKWVAGAGHNTWFFYEFYYNSDVDTTYLVKHGTWVEEGSTSERPGVAVFAEAHHGHLFAWDKEATYAEILSGLHTGGNDRLYVGFVDGTIAWTPLPQHGPNPAEDPNTEFTSNEGILYLPTHHSGFRADNKLWYGISAIGPILRTTEWIEVEYKQDVNNPLASWTSVNSPADPKFTLPGQKLPFVLDEINYPVYGKQLQLRIRLKKNPSLSASPRNMTPVIAGIVVHEATRPSFSREFTMTARIASFLPLRNGTVDRRRSLDIQQALLEVCAKVEPVLVTLPWGVTEEMTIIDYHDTSIAEPNRRDHEWGVQIQAIQLHTVSHEQVFEGLTYDTLELYTLDELESII